MNLTPDSLWAITVWDVLVLLAVPAVYATVMVLMSERARANRAWLRRRRRSERELVQRLRAW